MSNRIKVGTRVEIKAKESWAHKEWGIVQMFDGDNYHVALWNDENSVLIFNRSELIVKSMSK